MADANTLSANARNLWNQVQTTMSSLGFDTVLTSAGRSPGNVPRGGSKTSDHFNGNAFDFQVKDDKGRIVDPLAVQATLMQSGLGYGQNIAEYGLGMNPRNHLSIPTARHTGENMVQSGDGVYKRIQPNIGRALANAGRSKAKSYIDAAKVAIGLAVPGAAGVLGTPTPGSAVADAAGTALQPYLLRGAVGIVALLLIAAAIFALSRGQAVATVQRALK